MPASHGQVHDFSKTVWKFRYLCKYPVLKMLAAYVIFLSFKYNAAKFTRPPFCNVHFRDSQGGSEMCHHMFLPLSPQERHLSALSHSGGCLKKHHPSTGKGMSLGKVKSRSFKDPDPAPSLVPLDRAINNVSPSQTRMSAGLDLSKEGETCSIHMPLQIAVGLLTDSRKLGELRQDLYFQCIGLKGKVNLPN